jgi:hypothetical protein
MVETKPCKKPAMSREKAVSECKEIIPLKLSFKIIIRRVKTHTLQTQNCETVLERGACRLKNSLAQPKCSRF